MGVNARDLLSGCHWHEMAACAGKQDLFFSEAEASIEEAQQICIDECPVLNECSEWIAANPQPYGVWAGMSALERSQADPRQVVRCGTPSGYRRHRKHGQEPCKACREAWRNRSKEVARSRSADRERIRARKQAGMCAHCAAYEHTRHQMPCRCPKCVPAAPRWIRRNGPWNGAAGPAHGTPEAYRLHRALSEPPCAKCETLVTELDARLVAAY